MFFPKKVFEELLAATSEISTATALAEKMQGEWRKRVSTTVIVLCLIIFLLLGTIGFGWHLLNKETVKEEQSLMTSVKAISKLATIQQQYTDTMEWKENKEILLFHLQKSMQVTGSATVLAGVDLEKTDVGLERDGKTIQVKLPHAELFSVDSKIEFSGEDDMVFQRITLDDRNQLLNVFKGQFKQKALDAGILKQAEERARVQIESYLKEIGYETEVAFQ
jgi:hypothetical protein